MRSYRERISSARFWIIVDAVTKKAIPALGNVAIGLAGVGLGKNIVEVTFSLCNDGDRLCVDWKRGSRSGRWSGASFSVESSARAKWSSLRPRPLNWANAPGVVWEREVGQSALCFCYLMYCLVSNVRCAIWNKFVESAEYSTTVNYDLSGIFSGCFLERK